MTDENGTETETSEERFCKIWDLDEVCHWVNPDWVVCNWVVCISEHTVYLRGDVEIEVRMEQLEQLGVVVHKLERRREEVRAKIERVWDDIRENSAKVKYD
jgi:hypothetical protein